MSNLSVFNDRPRSRNVLNSFLNPWMLMGLAGVLLPVLAHLLSRKNFDRVDWGAMQFLELDPSSRRQIRLEEILLLLVRMSLVALIAVAMGRPWINGQWLGGYVSTQPRDVVIVIDGSYSMDWGENVATPRVQSLQLARSFLDDLRPDDTIQLIDAREQPHVVFPTPVRDVYRVREALNDLPKPAGSADIATAVKRACQLLLAGTNLHREVVVFTDLQAFGWKADDIDWWARFDDDRSQFTIPPRIWCVDAAHGELHQESNLTIERLRLSRELAVIGIPVKISSKVKIAGSDSPITRKVYLEIDQQRLNDQTVQLKLPPQGEATVEFEYRFETPGSHLISVVLGNDVLPADNRADAVVTVTESLPALLIDGDSNSDPTKCETYFAKAALASVGDEHPWIKATVITPEELTIERLKSASIAVIANVESLNESAIEWVRQFASSGHGVLFALGNKVDREQYRTTLYQGGTNFFPCQIESIGNEEGQQKRAVRVASDSLELPWLRAFRANQGGALGDARWSRWWKVTLPPSTEEERKRALDTEAGDDRDNVVDDAHAVAEQNKIGSAIIEASLTTGDPLIVSRKYGRGTVTVLTSALDADWNTLPAKQDYVPFLHELLFSLAAPIASRNVEIGQPLILTISPDAKADDFQFLNPDNKPLPAERLDGGMEPAVRLRTTATPGIYRFEQKAKKPHAKKHPEYFAVNFDRNESDTTPLTESQREHLEGNDRLKFVTDLPELRKGMFADNSRAEFYWLLLYAFLASLAIETLMTRRMIRGGFSEASK